MRSHESKKSPSPFAAEPPHLKTFGLARFARSTVEVYARAQP